MSFWKADAIASGIELAGAGIRANTEATAHLAQVKRLIKQRDDANKDNAANYAEKHALRAALKKIDPKHPLIANKALQEKIQHAGETTLSITHDWDAVATAGESFKY